MRAHEFERWLSAEEAETFTYVVDAGLSMKIYPMGA
jgi:hypothetical protein